MQYDILTEKITCDFDANVYTNVTCGTIYLNKSTSSLWLDAWIPPNTAVSTLIVRLTLKSKKAGEKEYSTFMGINNLPIDICKVMTGGAQSIFLDIIRKDFEKHSNVLQPCPYKVNIIPKIMNRYK